MKKKRVTSIYRQHFFLTAGMILLAFLVQGMAFLTLTYRYAIRQNKGMLDNNAAYIAQVMGLLLENEDYLDMDSPELQSALTYVAVVPSTDVIFCDVEGNTLVSFDSDDQDEPITGEQISSAVLTQTAAENGYHATSDLGIYAHTHFVVGKPILVQGQTAAYVFLTVSLVNLTGMWKVFGIIFAVSAGTVLVIAFLSSFFSTRRQVRPLREMTDIISRFGMGEHDLRVPVSHNSEEFDQLAEAFNTMADSIASSEQRRQEFVANISHELKTPMTTISGFTDGILDGTIPPEKQRESLQVVSDETRRLSRLVRKMLDMSQLAAREQEAMCQTQFDLVETYAQVLISLERKITSRGLDMDVQFPDTPVLVWGDPDSITQVCYNLLDNAIKFAAPGTAIGLSIVPKGTKAWVSVRDTGETIPPEELALIFDRFHKSDRSRSLDKEGVGLGLYIVKTILNSHKESITVTSENGVTEFQFTLTLAE